MPSKSIFKVGDIVELPEFTVVSVNVPEETAVIRFENEREVLVPFNFPPLGFSPNGVEGYMQPENLPFEHPGFILNREPNNMVKHRNSTEPLQLKLDRHFESNGEFVLIPKNGDTRYFKSKRWIEVPRHIKVHAESFLNKSFKDIKVELYKILDCDSLQYHEALLRSKITTQKKKFTFFVLLDGGVIYPFNSLLFMETVT